MARSVSSSTIAEGSVDRRGAIDKATSFKQHYR